MRTLRCAVTFTRLICVALCTASVGYGTEYRAFSLQQAQRVLKRDNAESGEARFLGGITKPAGCVFDEANKDVIIIGQPDSTGPKVTLDDLVVALRAVLKHGESPLVSIDPPSTQSDSNQVVRFAGRVENTQFGKDLLDADVVLKKLGLGKLNAEVWGVRSYFDLSADEWRRTGSEDSVMSRFWFLTDPSGSAVAARKDVGLVKCLKIMVQTETAASSASHVNSGAHPFDPIGISFAANLTDNLPDVLLSIRELRRLDQLYRLVGVASVIERWRSKFSLNVNESALGYWLTEAPVQRVETPTNYPPLISIAEGPPGRSKSTMTISGGIELRALAADVKGGSLTALHDLVLKSRPSKTTLAWDVSLGDTLDFVTGVGTVSSEVVPGGRTEKGMNLLKTVSYAGTTFRPASTEWNAAVFRASSTPLHGPRESWRTEDLHIGGVPQNRVGGVLLNDVASVEGGAGVGTTLGKGSFSVVVDGRDSGIDPIAYKRLVTALWAVYFGREDPGISIDPIAHGAERQLVRYIGDVKNLDLGRVMRDADYQMKKWAVGTEQPSIETFKTPDDYAKDLGTLYLGSMSRFWFVPENMRFKVTPDSLLFDSGNMTVKTEFLMSNAEGRSADPANERFAKWFTDNYHGDIVKRYPIYEQLYDYAKLVALAKYLKESGIPLYWFLMANKDLVLTEEAIGSVPTLFKDSTNFQGVKIEGGVNLVQKDVKSKGYVFDEATRNAIKVAYQKAAAERGSTSLAAERPKYVAQPVSLELGTNRVYTVIPQHSSSSGKDRRGIRYQTDVSLRTEGYEITPSVLAALQPAIRQRHMWNDLRDKMDNLTKGNSEAAFEAAFENALQAAQAKTGEALRKLSLLQGKFYPTEPEFAKDAAFALEDRDQFELLGDILVSYAKYYTSLDLVRVFDPHRANQPGDFGDGWRLLIPYRLRPASNTPAKGYRLPSKMEVVNLITDQREVLDFSTDTNQNIGYFPSTKSPSEFVGLFVLTDASFRLIDRIGCEFQFNSDLNLTDMLFTEDHSIGIEYLEKTGTAFEASPYRIVPENPDDRVTFQNVTLPKRMKVTDAFNSVQTLDFDGKKSPIGWYPSKDGASKFKVLALMSDGSYVLADTKGNEFSFDGGGSFTEVVIGPNEPIVRALKMGKNRISFRYRLDPAGNILIAKAWVGQDEIGAKPLYMINYDYDSTGRLANRQLLFASGKSVFDNNPKPSN